MSSSQTRVFRANQMTEADRGRSPDSPQSNKLDPSRGTVFLMKRFEVAAIARPSQTLGGFASASVREKE